MNISISPIHFHRCLGARIFKVGKGDCLSSWTAVNPGSEFLPEVLSVFVMSHLGLSPLFRSGGYHSPRSPWWSTRRPDAGVLGLPSSGPLRPWAAPRPSGARAPDTALGQLHAFLGSHKKHPNLSVASVSLFEPNC